jgi:hypothetical protein
MSLRAPIASEGSISFLKKNKTFAMLGGAPRFYRLDLKGKPPYCRA